MNNWFRAVVTALALLSTSANAQTIVRLTPGEVRIIDMGVTYDQLIMPPNELAEVKNIGDRLAIIGYKPGRIQVVAMNGNRVVASLWIEVKDAGLYERRAVTVYRGGKPQEVHSCSQETGACVFYKDLRPPPPPIISTGPVITGDAIRAGQGQAAQ